MTISIARTYFTLPVTLSVTGLPAGATGTLDAVTTTGSSATLNVTTSSSGTITPPGTYDLTIKATAGGVTMTAIGQLTVLETVPPTVTALYSTLWSGTTTSTTTPVLMRWEGSDNSGGSGIDYYTLQVAINDGVFSTVLSSAATGLMTAPKFGTLYQYRVQATDVAGNVSEWVYSRPFKTFAAQQTSPSISYSTGWYTSYTTSAMGGSFKYTTRYGASATFAVSSAGVAWVAYLGPNRGSAQVYFDGVLVETDNLYSSTYRSRQIMFNSTWGWDTVHTIRIVNLATYGHPQVNLDAFVYIVMY